MAQHITDWDDAYANGIHIPDGATYPARWQAAAAAFRQARGARARIGLRYGPEVRQLMDLFLPDFLPDGTAKGLCIFVHGGWWMDFDPSFWSHLAAGPLAHGWAVAMPGYTLAPMARIAGITRQIAAAIAHAAALIPDVPVALTGHSAGGHLVARMVCDPSPLPPATAARLRRCLPISALADLRPLMRLADNRILQIDPDEAMRESPILLAPRLDLPIPVWIGGDERPEFLRHSRILADIWQGMGADTSLTIAPGRHHFDVIEGLSDPDHPLTRAIICD
ncbi:alpha/beta hydrolase [Paracoccus pacificus]|uniref:Alpha/beta hydrolase n=1 Tax=Paracoccus pacificus TaxID=1463598 RepID=A0ABW4RBU1_9RHOB